MGHNSRNHSILYDDLHFRYSVHEFDEENKFILVAQRDSNPTQIDDNMMRLPPSKTIGYKSTENHYNIL